MIDANFFENIGKIQFETNTEVDTLQAIDNYSEKEVIRLCIVVGFISSVMVGITLLI